MKDDCCRLPLEREGDRVRLITRGGYNWTDRCPWIVEAARKNRVKQFVIDGWRDYYSRQHFLYLRPLPHGRARVVAADLAWRCSFAGTRRRHEPSYLVVMLAKLGRAEEIPVLVLLLVVGPDFLRPRLARHEDEILCISATRKLWRVDTNADHPHEVRELVLCRSACDLKQGLALLAVVWLSTVRIGCT